jgi:hypothetical protein
MNIFPMVESPVKKLKINKKANRYDQKSGYIPAIQLKKTFVTLQYLPGLRAQKRQKSDYNPKSSLIFNIIIAQL